MDAHLRSLRIHRDPWERFPVLDASYYLPILINNLYLNPEEQALLVWFVVHSVRNDLISYWDIPQNELVAAFFDFCRTERVYLGQKPVYDFLAILKELKESVLSDEAVAVLDHLVESFYDKMREEGKLRAFKKDYS